MCENNVYRYAIGPNNYALVPELEGTRCHINSPISSKYYYQGTSEGKLQQVSLEDNNFQVFRDDITLDGPITSIVTAKDETMGFVVVGSRKLYKINFEEFQVEGDMIREYESDVQDLLLVELPDQKEYLFVEGKEGLLQKFDAVEGHLVDTLHQDSGAANGRTDIIGMQYCKKFNCLIIGD